MKTPDDALRAGYDAGTLWTMQRQGLRARCALIARSGDWELCILVEGKMHGAERCRRGPAAFAVAERMKARMVEQGWEQIRPGAVEHSRVTDTAPDRDYSRRLTLLRVDLPLSSWDDDIRP